MTVTIDEFETVLRSYINTPFYHGGRVPGPDGGLDCGGMVAAAMKELGMTINDVETYHTGDSLEQFKQKLAEHCEQRQGTGVIEPGDLILLRGSNMYHHLMYWSKVGTVIHAWRTTGVNKVVESTMLPGWWDVIESVWHIKELEQWQQ